MTTSLMPVWQALAVLLALLAERLRSVGFEMPCVDHVWHPCWVWTVL